MSDPQPISKLTVNYRLPRMVDVQVDRDLVFSAADGTALTMDVYRALDADPGTPSPAVVLVLGYPDPGMERILGMSFKQMGSSVSWAQLIAASGMTAVVATNRQPESDLVALISHLRQHGTSLGIDPTRLGLWSSSGNSALALSLLMAGHTSRPSCAAFLYPMLMDLDGATDVAAASATFRFVNPGAGRTIDDLSRNVPLLIARAGGDEMPGLNRALDRFVTASLAIDLPVTVVNHPRAPHAFDLMDDSPATRLVVQQVLDFLRAWLVPTPLRRL